MRRTRIVRMRRGRRWLWITLLGIARQFLSMVSIAAAIGSTLQCVHCLALLGIA